MQMQCTCGNSILHLLALAVAVDVPFSVICLSALLHVPVGVDHSSVLREYLEVAQGRSAYCVRVSGVVAYFRGFAHVCDC